MQLLSLSSTAFRNLNDNATLQYSPIANIISGENGSGKTAFLEAIYYLGRGKSFRESQTRHIIHYQQTFFRLLAKYQNKKGEHLLGIERANREYKVKIDGEPLKSLSKLAEQLPVQIINSDLFALISAGPEYRRQFMDYGLFYENPEFFLLWRKYQYALKNRNAALREDWQDIHIRPWHPQLDDTAIQIDSLRSQYLQHLEILLNHYHEELGGLDKLSIHYLRGWNEAHSLETILDNNLARDRLLKHTRDGIHRAEWRILANGRDIAHLYSRGQQKTVICALILAQSERISEQTGEHPIILIDDIAAELDNNRQQLLIRFLKKSGSQLFITTIGEPTFSPIENAQYFNINQGIITYKSTDLHHQEDK